ncbi:MAG: hypothetical protein Q8O37_08470 [Sulfuricellaceae bacterium]|nr:hypothetical protein [Sulfuricellaceae bacterium]
MNGAVPPACFGVWQRRSLEKKGKTADTATLAFWIQTDALQASLCIPAGRPNSHTPKGMTVPLSPNSLPEGERGADSLRECPVKAGEKTSLAEYDEAGLLWLARQEGIAGMTLADGDLLHRRRQIDFQPTRGRDNTHRIRFEDDLLIEENLQGSSTETWQRLAGTEGESITLRLLEESVQAGRPITRKGYLLVVSDHFLFVRDRPCFTRQAASLEDLFEAQDLEAAAMAAYLDCEFSYGRRTGGDLPWQIQHSTLPWREGKALFGTGQFESLRSGGSALIQHGQGRFGPVTRRWSIQEWRE